jgi:putative ABC transport system substrate-binding protein
MRHQSRRQLLRVGLILAAIGISSGWAPPSLGAEKVPRIGFLAVGSREGRAFMIDGFLRGLLEHGYVEGQNILIEYRFSEGRNERLPALAAELVALRVDLILASGSPASFAAKNATRKPTRSRLVSSPAWRGRAATSRE